MTSLCEAFARRCAIDWADRYTATEREAVREIVRTAFIDTAACILAGRDEAVSGAVLPWARGQASPRPESTILFSDERLPASLAALVNGVAGHALDYDDVGLAGHPSVVLVPALWAEHERSSVAGFALAQAYAKGYAVWGELQRRLPVSLHARGWHPSAVMGGLATTAALAAARGLDVRQAANALGIAASMTGGVVANFGSMTKPLHIGRAAEAGFQAVELAGLGLDASADALDGRAGLLAALTGQPEAFGEAPIDEAFELTIVRRRPGIKQYPICYAAHRVVDGVLDLGRTHGAGLEDVQSVEATISPTAAGVMRHHRPVTVNEARFSLEFSVAIALAYGRVGLAEVSAAALEQKRIRDFLPRVRIRTTDTRCPIEPSFAFSDRVVLTLKDGRRLDSGPIRFARGHAELPLQPGQLREKLAGCVRPHEAGRVDDVLSRVDRALA